MNTLASQMNELAASTWHKIEVGPRRGIRFDERSLTDHNLFELDRLGASGIEVYKTGSEESRNGADFELWVRGFDGRWTGLRLQAKVVQDLSYLQLGHEVRGQRQYDLLLDSAATDGLWPMYCFYNGWDGLWPAGVRNKPCPNNVAPGPRGGTNPCSHVSLHDFGCAIAPATFVASRHRSLPAKGRLAVDDYLANSVPWSHLVSSAPRGGFASSPGGPNRSVGGERLLPAYLADLFATVR